MRSARYNSLESMEAKIRGSGLLVVGTVVLMAGVGAFLLYREKRKERPASLFIFHWIPSSRPLQISGALPLIPRPPEEAARLLDPSLVDRLRRGGVTGELRIVAEIPIDPRFKAENSGLLLNHMPEAPFTLGLVDAEGGVYCDQEPGLLLLPKDATVLGPTITLTPEKTTPGNWLYFKFTDPKGKLDHAGVARIFWW